MNLHIMLTSSTYTAESILGNPLSSVLMLPHCLGDSSHSSAEEVCNLTATRWVDPRPLCSEAMPMREVSSKISHEAIACLAYLFYLQDGSPEGKSKEHWAQAELFLSNLAS